jgi:hypothetical protein
MTDTHTEALVERVALAMQNAELNDGDEGNTYRLFDLLGFSGENKAVMIARQLARAAIEALPARNDERALKLVEAVKTAIQHAYEEGVEDGTEWAETTKFIGEQEPQWIDSVARVTSLQLARSLADVQPSGETR